MSTGKPNILQRLFGLRQRQPEPTLAAPPARSAATPQLATALNGAITRLPRARQTSDTSATGVLAFFEEAFSGYPTDNRTRIIRVLRALAQNDDDVGGALRDLQGLTVTPHTLELEGGTRAITQAEAELDEWWERAYQGGLKALADNQLREIYITGASSIEWVPEPNGRGVDCAIVVPAESIRARRGEDYRYVYEQWWGILSEPTPLHPLTYQHIPFDTDADSAYGIPIPITALRSLQRKVDLMDGEDRLIEAAQTLALFTAAVKPPDPLSLGVDSELDPDYESALQAYVVAVADLISDGAEKGLYVYPSDAVEMNATPVQTRPQGTERITDMNNRLVWSGLGTLPFMRGKMDSTTQALSQVVYPILLTLASNAREVLKQQLEHGMNLHLRLRGIPARAHVNFSEPPNPFILEHAQARKLDAETDALLTNLYGDEAKRESATRRGLDPDTVAPTEEVTE